MTASSVSRKPRASKASKPAEAPAVNKVEHAAAVWAAVGYLVGKNANRDELTAGENYEVKLHLVGQVNNGPIFRTGYDGNLSVGHDQEVAASHTPGGDKLLLAVAFSKMNEQTRAATIRDILADYASGELPTVDSGLLAAVENLQQQLRAGVKQQRRGSVKYDGKPSQPSLSLVAE